MKEKNKEKIYEIIYNNEKLNILAKKANNFLEKYEYLIKSSFIEYRKCYIFQNQNGFNSLFMKFSVDIVIVDKNDYIIEILEKFSANKISKYYKEAKSFYVFAYPTIKNFNFEINNKMTIERIKKT